MITSPALTLSIDTLFGNIKPSLDVIRKIGATDFSADAPGIDIKPGVTIKIPVSSVSAAAAFDETNNNYVTGGQTDWASLTATHYLKGYDIKGVDIDSGANAGRIKQLFASRAGTSIAWAAKGAAVSALDSSTLSTAIKLAASPALSAYIALGASVDWLDKATSCLVLNGSEHALLRGLYAAKSGVATDDQIAQDLGFASMVCLSGLSARAVIVPSTAVGFLARVPAILAKYSQAGSETDPDTGLSVGIVVAEDQATNKQIVNADLWFGAALLSSNATATTAGCIKVGTAS